MGTWGQYYWPFFLTLASALFLIPEVAALITNSANTLSDYCWREMSVNIAYGHGRHTIGWWASILSWGLFTVLITIHIWFRGV